MDSSEVPDRDREVGPDAVAARLGPLRGPEPLRRRVERQLREAIIAGSLGAGARLPSTRALAAELGVSRGVVVDAYADLAAQGYLVALERSSHRVAALQLAPTAPAVEPPAAPPRFDLRGGLPAVDAFPRAAWGRALRHALATLPAPLLAEGVGAGVPALRAALAAQLGRARGVIVAPQGVIVACSFTHALALVLHAAAAQGARAVAVEDPGYRGVVRAAEGAGLRVLPVPVDAEGLRVDLLPDAADVVVCVPGHQYPTGVVLTPARRRALVRWAAARSALVVEDDYDAELRFDRRPVGTVQGLAPDRVAYIGTTSKVLAPAMRVGWVVAPAELQRAVGRAKQALGADVPALDQAALAELLGSGALDRHLRRMRAVYGARRRVLMAAIAADMPEARPLGVAAGLHVALLLPADTDEARLAAAAAARRVRVPVLATSRIVPRPDQPGVVIGFGAVAEEQLPTAVRLIAEAARVARAGAPRD